MSVGWQFYSIHMSVLLIWYLDMPTTPRLWYRVQGWVGSYVCHVKNGFAFQQGVLVEMVTDGAWVLAWCNSMQTISSCSWVIYHTMLQKMTWRYVCVISFMRWLRLSQPALWSLLNNSRLDGRGLSVCWNPDCRCRLLPKSWRLPFSEFLPLDVSSPAVGDIFRSGRCSGSQRTVSLSA